MQARPGALFPPPMKLFQFPRWTDRLRPLLGLALVLTPVYLTVLFAYGASAENLNVGYEPEQPVPFSHALHAGELGLDCLYCHNTVEVADHAAIPPASTCMNCHERIRPESPKLAPVRAAAEGGLPVEWIKVHDLPEYVYFSHAPHVAAGVSCVECHGRVDWMERVRTVEPLSMSWCLDCHRAPEKHLRPRDLVTDLDWKPEGDPVELGRRLMAENGIHPRTDCSTCHR